VTDPAGPPAEEPGEETAVEPAEEPVGQTADPTEPLVGRFAEGASAEPATVSSGPAGEPAEPFAGLFGVEPAAALTGPAGEAAGPLAEEAVEPPSSRVHRARLAFRGWRRARPFWGGLIVVLGAAEILTTYQAPFGIIVHFGLYGLAGYLVPALLALLGFLIVFDPTHRTFYSVLSVLAALGTWLTSNLGGFFVGMLLGLVGGCLAFGWQYGERPARPARAERTKRRRIRTRAHAAE
jgi:hypothetical protein